MAKAINKISDIVLPEKCMQYFHILKSRDVKVYYKTKKKLGDRVWVHKETANVSLKQPGVKSIANYQGYKVRPFVKPGERALNESRIVL